MKEKQNISSATSSKGAAFFKKMIEDKKAISNHVKKGGKISELKEKYKFVKPLSTTGK